MDSSLEQAINDHLELQKRDAVLRRGQALADGWNGSADEEDEVAALEGVGTERRRVIATTSGPRARLRVKAHG